MAGSNSHAGHGNPQLDLLPVNSAGIAPGATHVAVRSGDWFDPATWGGEVPGQGDIAQIPAGIDVNYAGASEAKLFMVRVDGSLRMTADNGIATKMVVDTMITSPGSKLEMLASRATDGTIDLVFAEGTAGAGGFADVSSGDGVLGRYQWDPEQLSLGLVASGEVEIRGQETEGHMKVATGSLPGDSMLEFDAWTPGATTWKAGDTVVVGAANYVGHGPGGAFASQDEIRTITAIEFDGDRMLVHLDEPLDFFHTGQVDPRTGEELTISVGNLSRNVTLSSDVADQNGDGIADFGARPGTDAGPLGHTVSERGHVMFMHNDNVVVENSVFFGLGRTDKSVELDDFVTKPDTAGNSFSHRLYADNGVAGEYEEGVDTQIETAASEITNQRGRYALHIHMAGVGGHDDHDGHDGHAGHSMMDDEGGVIGPCARTGDPICHCSGIDEDGDGIIDYYLHALDDPDAVDGELVDTDGDGIADAVKHTAEEHAVLAGSRGAQINGNVIWGSPGWGIVQHDSRADLIGNVTYGVTGSAIVSETGNEIGLWQGNATFKTINARALAGNDDSDDFNDDFGHEGVGFWLAGRALDVVDNVAVSSARAGFMYRVNGIGQIDVLTEELGDLSDIKHGAETIRAEDVPITTFEGNEVIGALEGLRIITDPLDSVRKFNDAWSVMRDFTAWEIAEAGVSITYSSKYIFEDFLLLRTFIPRSTDKTGGFFFKTSVADVTVIDSHVEGFDHGIINWFSLGDRQEYRRGYWDPLSPTSNTATPAYEGQGSQFDIENPAHNLWNHTVIDFTTANLQTNAVFNGRQIEIPDTDGSVASYQAREVIRTDNADRSDDPVPWRGVNIELLDDSASGGLVALWRENLAEHPNYQAVLDNHIPLAYQDNAYLSQVHLASGQVLKRDHYLDPGNGIAADIWSGTVLEFAKTDSLGRQVFAYEDFSPLNWQAAERAVTTNEKIIFTREMIDGVLQNDGYYSSLGTQMKFVAVRSVFTDRFTGEYVVKEFLVGLDLAWQFPPGAQNLGHYRIHENSVVADEYGHFYNGSLVTAAAFVQPTVIEAASSAETPADALELLRDAEIDTGGRLGGYEVDTIDVSGSGINVSGVDDEDRLDISDASSSSGAGWITGPALHTEERDIVKGTIRDDIIRGLGGNDYLSGGRGNDVIDGGDGDDTIFGEHGNDTLVGGSGSDIFWMTRTQQNDVILDFNPDEDVIDAVRAQLNPSDISVRQEGTDLVISYYTTELRVVDTTIDDLDAENFLFG